MLTRVTTTPDVRPIRLHQEPSGITTDRFLKGQGHSRHTRADKAALEVIGVAGTRPTAAAAAREFCTSPYLVRKAVARIRRSKMAGVKAAAAPSIDAMLQSTLSAVSTMSAADRDQLVKKHQGALYSLFDRITAPAPTA
jgi:hypothetical protein